MKSEEPALTGFSYAVSKTLDGVGLTERRDHP